MNRSSIAVGAFVLVWLLTLSAGAVEYRLQVTHVNALTFTSYMGKATPWWAQNEPMGRLEARLDAQEFSPAAVVPGRQVQLLEDPAYGAKPPARLAVLPATRNQAWTTLVWEANPGDTVAFLVKSEMRAWQRVRAVAANPEGTLRRLSLGGPGFFGRQWKEVPEVAYDFIANAVDQGTFPDWLAQRAKAMDGMSIVVGQGRSPFYDPDRVYVAIKLPPEPRTYKLVIAWRDRNDRGADNDRGRGRIR
jgi:hypothetical protein